MNTDIVMHPVNLESTTERPANTTVNIQCRWSLSQVSTGGPCSISSSSMDSSLPSKMDYVEQITEQNNMDIKVNNPLLFLVQSNPTFNFVSLVPQPIHANNKVMLMLNL